MILEVDSLDILLEGGRKLSFILPKGELGEGGWVQTAGRSEGDWDPQREPVELWGLGDICCTVLPHSWRDVILGISATYAALALLSAGCAAFGLC